MVNDIRVLALDIDGVLTDGTSGLNESGLELKRISLQDLDAVSAARRSGLMLVLVTGEDTASVDLVARRFGIEHVIRGAKDKLAALSSLSAEHRIPLSSFCYVGDGDRDAPALSEVGLGLAPANATNAAHAAAHVGLSRSGGSGAVAEAIELLLRQNRPCCRSPWHQQLDYSSLH